MFSFFRNVSAIWPCWYWDIVGIVIGLIFWFWSYKVRVLVL